MSKITAYQTISLPAEGAYSESGSKFLAFAYPLQNEESIRQIRDQLRKLHNKAVHVAWACRLGLEADTERSSDDGEPSGSAGKPILNEMKSKSITQAGIFVVRYFGGKKLGIPGLIHAYGAAAKMSLHHAGIITVPIQECYNIYCKETYMQMVMHEINKCGARITNTELGETCNFTITFNSEKHEKILQKLESVWQIEVAFSHRF